MTVRQQQLALALFDVGAVKIARADEPGYTLKIHEKCPDAPKSPIYFNLRMPDNPRPGPLTPEIVREVGQEMFSLLAARGVEFDLIAGVPNAGDPFAAAVKEAMHGWKFGPHVIRLRKETSDGGRRVVALAEDPPMVGNVLLVDDLITAADSKLEAVNVLAENGFPVRDCIVVIDRDQGGREQLAVNNIQLQSLFRIEDLIQVYVEQWRIDLEAGSRVANYIRGNRIAQAI